VDVRRIAFVSLCLLVWVNISLCAQQHAANRPIIVCYGDSITAGYGLEPGQSFPDALGRDLDREGFHYQVLNRGTSGATTKDAVAGLRSVVQLHPALVLIEFGGNDGLRGLPLEQTRRNLDQLLTTLAAGHIKAMLLGITLPPNYGPEYIQSFEKLYRDLATSHRTPFVPMIYKDLVKVPGTIQPDGIHPSAKGSEILARTLLPVLEAQLRKSDK
jgi:acyl-CoA thioesterase-1